MKVSPRFFDMCVENNYIQLFTRGLKMNNDEKILRLKEENLVATSELNIKFDKIITNTNRILRRMYWRERICNWKRKHRRILNFLVLYKFIPTIK